MGVPQSSPPRSHMGKAGSDAGAKAKGARQPVFRDLLCLCANPPKRTGVARLEGSIGPSWWSRPMATSSLQERWARVDLWRHLPSKSVLGPA